LTTQKLLSPSEWKIDAFNVEKATSTIFNRLWYKGFFHQLFAVALPTVLFNVITSFLEGCALDISAGDARSTTGASQGFLLSPLLFAL
jgi:hypothetical protein